MSHSMHIEGFRPPDAKFKKMLTAYNACEAAGVDAPEEVIDFFNGETPDPAGVSIDLAERKFGKAVQEYHAEMQDGYEVNLDELPDDIRVIRFVNSY